MHKHEVNEYMKYAESWFTGQEWNGTKAPRQVYLATDDPQVPKILKEW